MRNLLGVFNACVSFCLCMHMHMHHIRFHTHAQHHHTRTQCAHMHMHMHRTWGSATAVGAVGLSEGAMTDHDMGGASSLSELTVGLSDGSCHNCRIISVGAVRAVGSLS